MVENYVNKRSLFVCILLALVASNTIFCSEEASEVEDPWNAARDNDLPEVKRILEAHPELLNGEDFLGRTPLHWATFNDQPDVVEFLIEKGADIDARAHDGMTPVHLATFWDKKNVVELLDKHGADIHDVTNEGKSALAIALEKDHIEIAKYLVNRYAAVGRLQEGIQNLPPEMLRERRDVLVAWLDDPEFGLPTDLRNLIIKFVTEL